MAGALIALNATATCATVSIAFAGYLNTFFPAPQLLVAFSLLALCTLVNIAGIKQATWFSIGLICIEVAGLLLIIFAGFTTEAAAEVKAPNINETLPGIFFATALIFFIFIGFEDVANLAEEAKEPKRNIPLALMIGVLITSSIYILVALSVLNLTTPDILSKSDSPLEAALANSAPWMGRSLSVAALFATASTALISLVSISRMLFGMARENFMPKILSKTLPNRKTPWVAALVLFVMACSFLPLGEIKIIASISSFGVLLVFISVQIAVIFLRLRKPKLKRGFKVPLAINNFPVIPAIGAVISMALITQFEPLVYLIGGGAVAAAGLIYFLFVRPRTATSA